MRLAGELRELRGTEQAVPHFLAGLIRLFSTHVAIRANFAVESERAPVIIEDVADRGWSTTSDRDRVYAYVTANPIEHDPLMAAALRRRSGVNIAHRADTMTRAEWERLPIFHDIHRPSGVDDSLLGIRWRSPNRAECIVLKRALGEPHFSEDDRELLRLVHTELGPFIEPSQTEPDARLTSREQAVFNLLIVGESEKRIASLLMISTHTVHHHVKGIYRKLDVGCRAELIAQSAAFARSRS